MICTTVMWNAVLLDDKHWSYKKSALPKLNYIYVELSSIGLFWCPSRKIPGIFYESTNIVALKAGPNVLFVTTTLWKYFTEIQIQIYFGGNLHIWNHNHTFQRTMS